jgi:membrane-bound ClpP family serine protease
VSQLLHLTISWEAWAILGLVLIMFDIFFVGSGNVLAAGIACFIMSALIGASKLAGFEIITTWEIATAGYVVALVPAVIAVRYLRPKDPGPDINNY